MKNLLIVALIGWAGYSAYTLYVEHPAEFAQKEKEFAQKEKSKFGLEPLLAARSEEADDKFWAARKHVQALRDTMLNKQWELSRPYANAVVNCIQQRVENQTRIVKLSIVRTAHPIVGTGNKYETGRAVETSLDILSHSFSVCERAKPNTIYVSR